MGDPTRGERCVFLAPFRAGATFGLALQRSFSPRSGGSRADPRLWGGRKPESAAARRGLGPQPLRTCLRPRGRGSPTRSGVPGAPESAFCYRPPGRLAPPFLKSLILTVAKALRNTAHCWQLPGGLTEL